MNPCQYEMRDNQDLAKKKETLSLQIVLAWRNVPKHDFLYRLSKVVYRHGLDMQWMATTYIRPYSKENILIMSLCIHKEPKGKRPGKRRILTTFCKSL